MPGARPLAARPAERGGSVLNRCDAADFGDTVRRSADARWRPSMLSEPLGAPPTTQVDRRTGLEACEPPTQY